MFKIDIKSWEPPNPEGDYKVAATCVRDSEVLPTDLDTEYIFLHTLGENGWEYLAVVSVADIFRIPEEGSEDDSETMVRRKVMSMTLPDPDSLLAAKDEIDEDSKALAKAIRAWDGLVPGSSE